MNAGNEIQFATKVDVAEVRTEIANVRTELAQQETRLVRMLYGTLLPRSGQVLWGSSGSSFRLRRINSLLMLTFNARHTCSVASATSVAVSDIASSKVMQ